MTTPSNMEVERAAVVTPTAPTGANLSLAAVLLGGSAAYAFGTFFVKALNFLLLPVFTLFLSPAEYGIISLAEIVALLVGMLGSFGLPSAISRLYYQYSGEDRHRYVSTALKTGALTLLAAVVLGFITGPLAMRYWSVGAQVPFFPYIALAIGTAAATQIVQYQLLLYQLQGRPAAYNALAISFNAAITGLALLLVAVPRWGAVGVLSGKFLAGLLGTGVAVFMLRRYVGVAWDGEAARETLVLGFPLLFHEFTAAGLVAADRFILARYRDVTEVGLYSLAYAFGMVIWLVTYSMLQAWRPVFYDYANRSGDHRRMLGRVMSGLALALIGIATVCAAVFPIVVDRLLDPRYSSAARIVPWIAGAYLLHGFFTLLQMGALQAKRSRIILWVSATAFVANTALNFALIPRWGMYGSAWATIASYALEAVIMYLCVRVVYPLPYSFGRILVAVGMFIATLATTQYKLPTWQSVTIYSAIVLGLAAVMAGPLLEVVRSIRSRPA